MTRYEALDERPDIELPSGWRLCITEKVTELCEDWAMAVRERNEAQHQLREAVEALREIAEDFDGTYGMAARLAREALAAMGVAE